MKKLNIQNKELRVIGFPADIVPEIMKTAHLHFRGKQKKSDVLATLRQLIISPDRFEEDPVWKKIAQRLLHPGQKNKPIDAPVELTGKRTYTIFGSDYIDEGSRIQMEMAMRLPVTLQGALMPDAHQGYGLPIGGVLAVKNAVIPYGVGMDIGCRMCLSVFQVNPEILNTKRDLLKNILIQETHFGKKDAPWREDHEIMERAEFREIKFLRGLKDKAHSQLGSSGSGNHFVEFGIIVVENPEPPLFPEKGMFLALLSHSGSRNFGAEIAGYYTKIAKEVCKLPKGAQNLAWLDLDTEAGQEYWMAMTLAGDYASANHQIIHDKIAASVGEKPMVLVENHHNFAWKEILDNGTEAIVHRKGATPAGINTLGIIPGSMATPGFVVKGKGNSSSINSASHGAGRLMSRKQAKERFNRKELYGFLKKEGIELIGGDIDESPFAYKDIRKVMSSQSELVDIVAGFYPKIVRMSGD